MQLYTKIVYKHRTAYLFRKISKFKNALFEFTMYEHMNVHSYEHHQEHREKC